MKETMIIKIIFGSFLSIGGFVLMLLSFKLYYKYLIQEKRCTRKTKGVVKKYTLGSRGTENSGIHLPIVYYHVNNKEYKVVGPEYKWYTSTLKSSPFRKNEMSYEEKGNGNFTIERSNNSFLGIKRNPMSELYPLNTEIDVYYDPSNPKLSYVLRYCNKKWIFYLMFFSSIIIWIIDLLILFLL